MNTKAYKVRAAHCDHWASDEEVHETLCRVTDPLTRSWDRLEKAKRIVIKFNMMNPIFGHVRFEGRRQQLVDDAVCRSVLRLLRERTSAELLATDTNPVGPEMLVSKDFIYADHLREFGVDFVDSNVPPFSEYDVPGGGAMFDRYTLNAVLEDADEIVSVAKMKNHLFMGITLCMKNLFGLPPMTPPEAHPRSYYHHAIRLSYVLPDLAMITDPCLNIIDALVGQWGREWGGEGRIGNALVAGDQVTATDTCGAHLMGCDPVSDWPKPPFRRDRNHLLVAANRGFGTVDLDEIDFEKEVSAPLNDFDSEEHDPPEVAASIRRTACEQALIYQEQQHDMVERFRNQYVYLCDGDVVWHGTDPSHIRGHGKFVGQDKPGQALWLKFVDPDEREGEKFGVYNSCLSAMTG